MNGSRPEGDRNLDRLPIAGWLPGYAGRDLRRDAAAAAVVTALMVPQALGYAAIAGVPVQVGLYAIPLALIAYAVLGSSPQLVVGPVSTVSVVSGSFVALRAGGDPAEAVRLTVALAIASGVVLIVAGLLRLGWIAEFLSKPIITGFVFGLSVLIVVGEIPGLLGLPQVAGNVFARMWAIGADLDQIDPATASIGLVALLVLFGAGRALPRAPWGLLLVGAGILVSGWLDLSGAGVAVVGEVPRGLPAPALPRVDLGELPGLLASGGALALVGLAESLGAARLFASKGGYRVDADQELLATGAANVASGVFGGLGVAGSLSKTGAAARSGATSQMVGLVSAGLTVVVLVAFAPYLSSLPRAVLSAIVIHAVWGFMDVKAVARYRRIRRNDFVGAVVALGGVLVLGTLYGLLLAIGQSVLGLVYRSTRVQVDVMGKIPHEKAAWGPVRRHPERRRIEGILVLRPTAPLFWVNATRLTDLVEAEIDAQPATKVVVLDMQATNQMETTSADALSGLIADIRRRGMDVYLVRVMRPARLVLERTGVIDTLGPGHVWHNIAQAVKQAKTVARIGLGDADDTAPEVEQEHIAADADPGDDEPEGSRGGPISP